MSYKKTITKAEVVKILLVVFPSQNSEEVNPASLTSTAQILQEWIKYNSTMKNPTIIDITKVKISFFRDANRSSRGKRKIKNNHIWHLLELELNFPPVNDPSFLSCHQVVKG
jgi:hypothetical protein